MIDSRKFIIFVFYSNVSAGNFVSNSTARTHSIVEFIQFEFYTYNCIAFMRDWARYAIHAALSHKNHKCVVRKKCGRNWGETEKRRDGAAEKENAHKMRKNINCGENCA